MISMVSIDNIVRNFEEFIDKDQIVPAYVSVIKSLFSYMEEHPHGTNIVTKYDRLVNIDDIDAATEGDIFAYEPEVDTELRVLQSAPTFFTYTPKLYTAQFVVSDEITNRGLAEKTGQSVSLLNKIFDKASLSYVCSLSPLIDKNPFPIDSITAIANLIATLKTSIVDATGGQDFTNNFRFLLTGKARNIMNFVSAEGMSLSLERQNIVQVPNSMIAKDEYKDAILAVYQPEVVCHHGKFPGVIATEHSFTNSLIAGMRKTTVVLGMHSLGIELYNPNAMMYAKVKV